MKRAEKNQDAHLRLASVEDQPSIIQLIGEVYQEYGERICLADADADLLDIRSSYPERGGAFVVLEVSGQVQGTHAWLPINPQQRICTFRRLYLRQHLRGGEWGERLMDWAIEQAGANGYRRIEFWSDTRFERAHAFFRRLGFVCDGVQRTMNDGYEPYDEFQFFLEI